MADLLSNRADAYARAFTSGLGLGRVLFNDLYRYTFFFFFFFSARHRRAAGTFFFFVGNQELIRSEAPALSSRLQVTHARCIFFYAVVIAVEPVAGGCARARFAVSKKKGGGGEKKRKKKNSLAHTLRTHTRHFSSRAGDKTPRDAQIIIRVAFSRLFAGSVKSRAKKIFLPLEGGGGERRLFHFECTPSTADLVHRHCESDAFCVTGD